MLHSDDHNPSAARPRVRTPHKLPGGKIATAVQGLRTALREERGVRSQLLGVVAMAAMLLLLRPPMELSMIAMFAALTVFVLELVNTALERLVDVAHPHYHPTVGKLKDIAAAAVVASSMGVLVIGLIVVLVALS